MVARKAKSKKAKGTKLENKIAELYRRYKIDETARRMPLSGAMAHFKSDIYKRFDLEWVDECKNHETISFNKFWEQASSQAGLRSPVLHISGNYRPIITVITWADFTYLVDEDERRYEVIDITNKKRWGFWDYASQCSPLPRATVIKCYSDEKNLAVMLSEVYFKLRKERL